MGKFNEFPFIRKSVAIFTVFWAVACSAMYWSMRNSPRGTLLFFIILGAVPIALAWGLLMAHLHALKLTTLPDTGHKTGAGTKGKNKKKNKGK